jgi:hypothetical protein
VGNSVTIKVAGDFSAVSRALKEHPRQARLAANHALNRTISTVRKESVTAAATATKVKARLIRKRHATFNSNPRSLTAVAYFHVQPIPAHSLNYPGEARQLKRGGVRAGKHTFKQGFKGVYRRGTRKGKPNIFEFRAGSRTRVVRSMLVIREHGPILIKVGKEVSRQRFLKLFHRDLNYRLKRHAGSV